MNKPDPYDIVATAAQRLALNSPKTRRPFFFLTGFEAGIALALRYPRVAEVYQEAINEAVHEQPGRANDFINYLCAQVQSS